MEFSPLFITRLEFNMDQKAIINVKDLSVWHDTRLTLDNLNFSIYPGEVFMIIGGSGCGKTTLLNSMIGLHEELKGKIIIDDNNIIDSPPKQKQQILKKIGVMYQSGALFGSLTLLENVMFPLEELASFPKDAIASIGLSKLELVGLSDFYDFMPAEISGGMQKRAAIARAMALEPKILFLDEPSAGLDPITAAQLDNLIIQLSQTLGMTFVIVSHELASIYAIATRVIMLHNKKIIAEGLPKELRNSSNTKVYNFFHRVA
jgi:phospholipid/cholesterol/gamma-HCH transport system ATP-binding protein